MERCFWREQAKHLMAGGRLHVFGPSFSLFWFLAGTVLL